jgi:hypothetical protein
LTQGEHRAARDWRKSTTFGALKENQRPGTALETQPSKNSPAKLYARPRKNRRGLDLISDVLPFGRLWYGEPNPASNAVDYVKFFSRSHDAVIRVYDAAGNVIEAQSK